MLKANKDLHFLDFGCGRGDYVRELSEKGFNVQGLEFFVRKTGKALDIEKTNRMVDSLIHHLKHYGKFDVLLCDYVLNSVISKEAENDVLNCMNIFTKMGGKIFFSGHRIEEAQRKAKSTICQGLRNTWIPMEFHDKDYFTGKFYKGYWFFQLNHTDQQAALFAEQHGMAMDKFKGGSGTFWYVEATKIAEIPEDEAKASLSREFNMPYNAEKTVTLNRHEEVIQTLYGDN
jgi:hypothetical protein